MPTFYLSNLNPGSTALGQAGEFGGQVTAQPPTNSTTRVVNITTATAQAYFKFYMSGGRIGVSSASNGALTFTTPDTTRSDQFLQLLATEVFGSSESSDLFSNKGAIVTSWETATADALGLLNGLINTAGDDASLELVNAMFDDSTVIGRFTLSNGYTGHTGTLVTGTGYAVSTTGSGSGAKVNVTMKDDPSTGVKSITVHTAGTGYAKGDTITITDGDSDTATIILNSYQAASLIAGTGTGTLSNTDGIEVPLAADDVIRVLYTITSETNQEDTSGDAIQATQTFFVDYTLTDP